MVLRSNGAGLDLKVINSKDGVMRCLKKSHILQLSIAALGTVTAKL
jgi:hypothetical protein